MRGYCQVNWVMWCLHLHFAFDRVYYFNQVICILSYLLYVCHAHCVRVEFHKVKLSWKLHLVDVERLSSYLLRWSVWTDFLCLFSQHHGGHALLVRIKFVKSVLCWFPAWWLLLHFRHYFALLTNWIFCHALWLAWPRSLLWELWSCRKRSWLLFCSRKVNWLSILIKGSFNARFSKRCPNFLNRIGTNVASNVDNWLIVLSSACEFV